MKNVFYNFYICKSRLDGFLSSEKNLHTARFAKPHELVSLSHPSPFQTGLLLGKDSFGRVLQVHAAPGHPELGNLGIFAPPRSGKSVHLKTQLLTWDESAVVNDPKGELFRDTAGYKAASGHKVFVFSPTGIGHRLDPLTDKETEDDLYDAATQLLHTPHEGEGKKFTQRATHMLTQLFLAARVEKLEPFPYVRSIVRLGLPKAAEHIQAVSPELATQFLDRDYEKRDFDDKFLTSAWASLTAGIRSILTETVVRSLSGNDLSLADLLTGQSPVTIYLRWPERYLLTLRPLMKLLWGSILEELKQISDESQKRGTKTRRVLCLVDEAGVTPIHELEKHIATANARGISFILAYQSKSQIAENHGSYNAETILNSLDSQLYLRQASLQTAEYVSRLLGDRSGFALSQSEHHGEETSRGQSEREVPLLTPQKIMQLADGRLIGFHRNFLPFEAESLKWWTYKTLVARQKIKAPELPILPPLEESISTPSGSPQQSPEQEQGSWGTLFPSTRRTIQKGGGTPD
jgi:type IV secretion system protein VirD4